VGAEARPEERVVVTKKPEKETEKEDRFYKELEFGTAGLRGKVGMGSNRMNRFIIARATKALAQTIIDNGLQEKGIAIAHDPRLFSKEFAKLVGCTVGTLQRWDREGILVAHRNPNNRRFYTEEQLEQFLLESSKIKRSGRKNVAYCRASSQKQKSSIENQEEFISVYTNAKGVIIDEVYSDIGSGLNYERPQWNKLLEMVRQEEIDTIYVTYKDRFVRFGFDWFNNFCEKHGAKIIVLNQPSTSNEQELVEDLLNIVTVFSARSHRLRTYKKQLEQNLNETNSKNKSKLLE